MNFRRSLRRSPVTIAILAALAGLLSCDNPDSRNESSASLQGVELFRVGSIVVYDHDLERRLLERYPGRDDEETRKVATKELILRAQFAQAALDAGLLDDSLVRDEISRLLMTRLREIELTPSLERRQKVPEVRLREIYEAEISRFQAPEKRQVAALWLNPGPDPGKVQRDTEKMQQAREFILQDRDLQKHPEKGFSVLGADYSEHSASRFRGGVVGWLQREGGPDEWTRAVAEIAFTIKERGVVSAVETRSEGVFLVRLMDLRPAVTRPFESVAAELEGNERTRLRKELETEFERQVVSRNPVVWPDR